MYARVGAALASMVPLVMAVLVAKLWLTGTLRYYVNDRTVWIVLAGAMAFVVVGIVGARSALRSHGDGSFPWRSLIFLAPAVLGIVLPARPLSGASGQASSLGSLQLASHVSSGDPGDQFGYWITSIADHSDPRWWEGQRVTLVGFVAHQQGLPARSFILGRYLVTCCVVDATLLGFPVQIDRGRQPPDGAWIQVSGVFGSAYWTDPSGAHYPVIYHARLSTVSIPSSPYLSP